MYKLRTEADNHNRNLYGNNQAVYNLLRYGVPVKIEAGKVTETVHLINWSEPEKNDFAIAEEVTLKGNHERRPDLVLYVNGIAIGVLELKNSRVTIGDGIRQNAFQPAAGVQRVVLQHSAVRLRRQRLGGAAIRHHRHAGEVFPQVEGGRSRTTRRFKLDKYLLKMCGKERLIELMHDFVLFDGGVKKLPRVHQYFGIKAAQEHVRQRRAASSGTRRAAAKASSWCCSPSGFWRTTLTPASPSSPTATSWTSRSKASSPRLGEAINRTSSGRDLMSQLGQAKPRLLCSLVHKFGRRDVDDFDAFIKELEAQPSQTVGEVFVFVDECHRTQSGKLHRVMKAMMPNAVFIGFTGTPLLKKDRQTSLEVFGGYIHTYKFSEAVEDEVVLDLVYEARDIDQRLGSEDKIDAWFEAKTKGLNDWQKDELKKQWGTMQNVLSSKSRMDRVVSDIVFDFSVKPRLSSERGNAILVASSIYEACKYFTLFQKTPFKGKCAVVTSYNPLTKDVTHGGNRREHRDRQAVHLQHLHGAAEGR